MLRKLLLISSTALLIFLATKSQAKPLTSLRILNSPYAKYRKWIEAQARHESNNYQSNLAKEYNNIFGMGVPIWRDSVNAGSTPITFDGGKAMSAYRSVDQAIQDFLLYLESVNFPTDFENLEGYVSQMQMNNYFEDTYENYLNGLKRYL